MFTLISWNIQQGGGSRLLTICQQLIQFDAHVIALSEFHNNQYNVVFSNTFTNAGYIYQYCSKAPGSENTVFIASKLPGEVVYYPDSDPLFYNNILGVTFSAFGIMAMYLPHKKKHNLLSYIKNTMEASHLPYILVGDFNTGHNSIDQKGDSFWYEKELIALEKSGYVDAFRHLHGTIEEYSWFSHQGNGYRYDHSYVHHELLPIIKKCYYLHEWRLAKLSDHSPMILQLG